MEIRKYRSGDCIALAELFDHTVHTVNAADYTAEQLDAWSPGEVDLSRWDQSFQEHHTLLAVEGETVLGFGDMAPGGYLDRLYVHADYQGRGVATAICEALERPVRGKSSPMPPLRQSRFLKREATGLSGNSRWSGGAFFLQIM